MSVPEGKRTESKLKVQTKSKELARYTTSICSNEKIFPKRDRWKRKRKLRKFKKLVDDGRMTREKADECYRSWKAHAKKGNSYNLLKRMDEYYKNLWKE